MKTNHLRYADTRGARSPVFPEVNRAEVARRLNISRAHMSKILSGKARPSTDILFALAELLKMDAGALKTKLRGLEAGQ